MVRGKRSSRGEEREIYTRSRKRTAPANNVEAVHGTTRRLPISNNNQNRRVEQPQIPAGSINASDPYTSSVFPPTPSNQSLTPNPSVPSEHETPSRSQNPLLSQNNPLSNPSNPFPSRAVQRTAPIDSTPSVATPILNLPVAPFVNEARVGRTGLQSNNAQNNATRGNQTSRGYGQQPDRNRSMFQPTGSRNNASNRGGIVLGEQRTVQKVLEENRRVKERYNEMKITLQKRTLAMKNYAISNKAFATMYKRLEQERDLLKLENESLRSLPSSSARDNEQQSSRRRAPKAKFDAKKISVMFHGIANNVSMNVLQWCDNETKELVLRGDIMERNWNGRSEKAVGDGIRVSDSAEVVPISPLKLAQRREYFTPSFKSEKEMLSLMIEEEMKSITWTSHFRTDVQKDVCRRELSEDVILRQQIKQTLSDRVSGRKRSARDKLFQCLGYTHLLSRKSKSATRSDENEEKEQRREVIEKFAVSEDGNYDFSTWRLEYARNLAYSNYDVPEEVEREVRNDELFRHMCSVHVLHEFRGYSVEKNPDMLSSIMLLARLDSWVATVVSCMKLEDGRGGQRQRKFNEIYSKFLPIATTQLLSTVSGIVWKLNPVELNIRFDTSNSSEDQFENGNRIATKILESRSDGCFYISVLGKWFQDYVSKQLGFVCDCFIGEGTVDGQLFQLYGTMDTYEDGQRDSGDLQERNFMHPQSRNYNRNVNENEGVCEDGGEQVNNEECSLSV